MAQIGTEKLKTLKKINLKVQRYKININKKSLFIILKLYTQTIIRVIKNRFFYNLS